MAITSRRTLLAGLAAAPAVAGPVLAKPASSPELDALWTEMLAVTERQLEISRRQHGASLGPPPSEDEVEAADTAFWSVYDRIMALPCTLPAIAAKVLIEVNTHGSAHHTFDAGEMPGTLAALTGLRPLISGPVATTVADYLDHQDRPLCYGPLWGGYEEPGQTVSDLFRRAQS